MMTMTGSTKSLFVRLLTRTDGRETERTKCQARNFLEYEVTLYSLRGNVKQTKALCPPHVSELKPKRRPTTKQNWNRFRQPIPLSLFHWSAASVEQLSRASIAAPPTIIFRGFSGIKEDSLLPNPIILPSEHLALLVWHSALIPATGQIFTTTPLSSPTKTSIEPTEER